MDRRQFLFLTGGIITVASCNQFEKKTQVRKDFPIHVDSNSSTGHLVKKAVGLSVSQTVNTDILIVGGGISGMAAACSLPSNNFILCELNPRLGGTSSALSINNVLYSQGAHYEHSYLHNYGKDGLELLKKLNIVRFNTSTHLWDFVDKENLVPKKLEEACYVNGTIQPSVLPNSELRHNFFDLIKVFREHCLLPTTLIPIELHDLDRITFYDYLKKYLPIDNTFISGIDYHMLDDYGATSREISALAGIHYYACRPYYTNEEIRTFSPTEGNYYFINKMKNHLPADSLKCNHLVFNLTKNKEEWHAEVLDVKNNNRKKIIAQKVIYSGQKHALKYIHPTSYQHFKDVTYTPWVVINVVFNQEMDLPHSKWQNDFMSNDPTFLGFTDSKIQSPKKTRVLSAYYCFPDMHHYTVQNIETSYRPIVQETIQKMSTYYKKDISLAVKEVFVKLMGHAMPIPQPGYLTQPRKLHADGIAFAGADSGRLPLLFDALDSGIVAAKSLF